MNIKKSSYMVLGLVMGVSVILYIFDVPIIPSSTQLIPTISIPSIIPTQVQIPIITTAPSVSNPITVNTTTPIPTVVPTVSLQKQLSETIDYGVGRYNEQLIVTASFNGTTIADLQVSHGQTDGTSGAYQSAFESEIKPMVIGKKISDINVSSVAGASYTTAAFMDAINRMRSKI